MCILSFARLTAAAILLYGCNNNQAAQEFPVFDKVIVNRDGPTDPSGKTRGHQWRWPARPARGRAWRSGLVWYENPNWKKHVIDASGSFGTDHEIANVDGDGRMDVVSLRNEGLVWYRNLGNDKWQMTTIDNVGLHDIEIADLDHDGRLDIIGRGQTSFAGTGHTLYLYSQRSGNWRRSRRSRYRKAKVSRWLIWIRMAGRTSSSTDTGSGSPGKAKETWKLYRFAATDPDMARRLHRCRRHQRRWQTRHRDVSCGTGWRKISSFMVRGPPESPR